MKKQNKTTVIRSDCSDQIVLLAKACNYTEGQPAVFLLRAPLFTQRDGDCKRTDFQTSRRKKKKKRMLH